MIEYIFIAVISALLILLYCFINRPEWIALISGRFLRRGGKPERKKPYMEAFREHKAGSMQKSMAMNIMPWLGIFAIFMILSNQYIVFALIMTSSMEPTLHRGDLILMQTVDRSVKVGDIVTYGKSGFADPITHRVVEITRYGNYITKGDNNPTNDDPAVEPYRVAGKIVLINGYPIAIPGAGYLIKPDKIGEFTVVNKLPPTFVIAQAFDQFRTVSPLILFFGTIFYFLLLLESRDENIHRFGRNGKNGKNGKNSRNGLMNGTRTK